jgi:hypothetical protein
VNSEQLNRLARHFRTVDEIGFHGFSLYLLQDRTPSTSMLAQAGECFINEAVSEVQRKSGVCAQRQPGHYHTHRV